jgi:hypothetical protein
VPDTLIEKVLSGASGGKPVSPGDIVVCDVDMAVLLDLQFSDGRLGDVLKVPDPDKLAIVMDHAVPAPSIRDAEAGKKARAFAAAHGIGRLFDIGRHGIVHQVVAERGLAQPGTVLACSDSHTCAAGAFGAAARGLGPVEMLQIVCTGRTWYEVPRTLRYELTGKKHSYVSGKDIFLHIAGKYGDASDHAVEFAGSGLASLPMADRRTIATQGAEIAADFTIFPADQLCLDFIARAVPDAAFSPCLVLACRQAGGVIGQQSGLQGLPQAGSAGVARRHDRGNLRRPGDANVGVERVHAPLKSRVVGTGEQVDDGRAAGKGEESVPDAGREDQGGPPPLAEPLGVPGAERRRPRPQIHRHVEHLPGHAGHHLGLGGRDGSDRDAAQRAPHRHRAVDLRHLESVPGRPEVGCS